MDIIKNMEKQNLEANVSKIQQKISSSVGLVQNKQKHLLENINNLIHFKKYLDPAKYRTFLENFESYIVEVIPASSRILIRGLINQFVDTSLILEKSGKPIIYKKIEEFSEAILKEFAEFYATTDVRSVENK